jgi:hypothetical protein
MSQGTSQTWCRRRHLSDVAGERLVKARGTNRQVRRLSSCCFDGSMDRRGRRGKVVRGRFHYRGGGDGWSRVLSGHLQRQVFEISGPSPRRDGASRTQHGRLR